jgi:glucose/arabinose dehydrogenase/cytochrome c553
MDVGQFYSATIWTPQEMTLKGIAVRVGEKSEGAVLFDTELLRVVCGWDASDKFLEFNPARYGIIGPPKVGSTPAFHSPRQPGWARDEKFDDPRSKPFGPLPREWAKYRGLHRHGDRIVFEYTVGPKQVVVLESPWIETLGNEKVFSRELEIEPSDTELELLVASAGTPVKLVCEPDAATLSRKDGRPVTAKVAKHNRTVRINLLLPLSANSASLVLQQEDSGTLRTQSSQREDSEKSSLRRFVKAGPPRWTAGITTRGVLSDKDDPLVVDTLTLPFDNPYKALMFVGGHDFFVSGRALAAGGDREPNELPAASAVPLTKAFDAAICTLHGDVWLVGGIDDKLEKLTWKRFATGLFQPLGLKIVKNQIFVVGRDQITRLHDLNGDGEADWYENFNNDAQVSANGHEYVTCLETDSDGWFYFLKGNCDGKTDHDGCLLRVSPDGRKLEVVATGFRNANGLGIERNGEIGGDFISVAPQEGEWTPGSAIFQVWPGHFYGYVPSAHREEPPRQFMQPVCWIPRLQDNSCGGQVWLPHRRWGLDRRLALHLSYGTSRAFLWLLEDVPESELAVRKPTVEPFKASGVIGEKHVRQGGTVPLPIRFDSGVMRARFHPGDGHLYVSGLRGWVSNAAQDGCLQRVRYTGRPLDLPVAVETFRDGLLLTFSNPLDGAAAGDPDNYRVQQWNYRWSAAYGSPELKVSNPLQEGRDEIEVLSATPIGDNDDVDRVFLELKDFQPVDQLSMEMSLKTKNGRPLDRRIDYTIHAVRSERFKDQPTVPKPRPGELTEAEQQRLVPGIRCEFTGQVENLPHVRRMAAWRFERYELAEAREIVATGYLVAPRRGKYRFAAEGNSASEVAIGDQVAWRSADESPNDVELARGHNRLKIVQRVTRDQPLSFRLLWSGAEFDTEPIPPTALFCKPLPDEVEVKRIGCELFARHQCVRCHRVADEILSSNRAMPELHGEAPDLIGVGSRLRGDWIVQWVFNPKQMRRDARMPRLFPLTPTDEHRRQAADLAAYLASLTMRVGEAPAEPTASDAYTSSARQEPHPSGLLWEDLGCLGCHRLAPHPDASVDQRTSLQFVRDKFQPNELIRFLQHPQRHFRWTRMPDFNLTDREAESLALALLQLEVVAPQKPATRPLGDAARGQKLFASLGCRQCHRVSRDEPLPKPHLPSIFGQANSRGCLAEQDKTPSPRSPDFHFDPAERAALVALLRGDERQLAMDTSSDVSRRFIAELQCAVCHPRDGRRSSLPELLAEEGATGRPPEVLPNLTWAGERLHATWIHSLLSGQIAERPRPWMKLRMPSFPARAKLLAEGLAREHGLSSDPSPRPNSDPDLAEIGEVLATRAGTLDCRQCHSIGPLPPTGDKNTLLAPGINFALSRERLRQDFYRRFTLDPPRYDVTTRMPKLTLDGRTTKFTDILDGDARQQFEAVWHFLQSVPSATADP